MKGPIGICEGQARPANMRDIRASSEYGRIDALYRQLRKPGSQSISDISEVRAAPDGRSAMFTGVSLESLEGAMPARIYQLDLESGRIDPMTNGESADRSPRYAPDGRTVAFLSDRLKRGDFQLYVLDPESGEERPAPSVEGWIEYLQWSPDGRHILLGTAGHGADLSGGQGGTTSERTGDGLPAWLPLVDDGDDRAKWRSLWIYDVEACTIRPLAIRGFNIWEACWCGPDRIAAVASPGPDEGLWYSAVLIVIDVANAAASPIFTPEDQIGWPAANPCGSRIALVEAACSDRGLVAGALRIVDASSGAVESVATLGADISYAEWRSDTRLLLAGHRGLETVVALYDLLDRTFVELWSSCQLSVGGRYAVVSGIGEDGTCLLEVEGFLQAPAIARLEGTDLRILANFDLAPGALTEIIGAAEPIIWDSPDGLGMEGWLITPKGEGPHPTITYVHGGPVYHWRTVWPGRSAKYLPILTLPMLGYAVFLPNPRGSCGRGLAFARAVRGDMGGSDAADILSGIDQLVATGRADAGRLGIMGGSYGGYMTSWLITQDHRFGAAIPFVPMTNLVTQQLTSNAPEFVDLFTTGCFDGLASQYFSRSPIMHASNVRTPTLNICGALDRCTPPTEALQFHTALRRSGVETVLVTYPNEGHGVMKLPTIFDYLARISGWFQQHIPTGKVPQRERGAGQGRLES